MSLWTPDIENKSQIPATYFHLQQWRTTPLAKRAKLYKQLILLESDEFGLQKM